MSPRVSTRLLAMQSDERLLALVSQGHERAFEAVVLRYRRPLLSYCRRMGLAEGRAEDVLQAALMNAWMSLQRGTEVRELRPWLYRIVHNAALNAMRSRPEELGVDLDALAADPRTGEGELERRAAARQALTDVAALPPLQRDALVLSAIDGRSHEEVALALGVSDGAVRGLLYRARSSLRAAAAALTPAPLVQWAAASGSGAPAGTWLATASATGGTDVAGLAVKGAALAVGAALAAGAVIAPRAGSGGSSAHRANGATTVTSVALSSKSGPATTQSADTGPGGSAAGGAGAGRGSGGAGANAGGSFSTTGPAGGGRSVVTPGPTWQTTGAGATGGRASRPGEVPAVVAGKDAGSAGSGSGAGSGAGTGTKTTEGEGTGTTTSAEKEAEAAREAKELEAERAREAKAAEEERAKEAKEAEAERLREAKELEAERLREAKEKGN